MKEWLEQAKDAAMAALGVAGICLVFGAVAGFMLGAMYVACETVRRVGEMLLGVM